MLFFTAITRKTKETQGVAAASVAPKGVSKDEATQIGFVKTVDGGFMAFDMQDTPVSENVFGTKIQAGEFLVRFTEGREKSARGGDRRSGTSKAEKTFTREQAAEKLGISKDALRKRLARGSSVKLVGDNLVVFV